MTTYELINAYAYNMTADIVIAMRTNGDDVIIFNWDANDNRHPDDGSYANVCHYIPNDIANATVKNFTVVPQHIIIDNKPIKLGDTERLYIVIPMYSNFYKYLEDDNYPFI